MSCRNSQFISHQVLQDLVYPLKPLEYPPRRSSTNIILHQEFLPLLCRLDRSLLPLLLLRGLLVLLPALRRLSPGVQTSLLPQVLLSKTGK